MRVRISASAVAPFAVPNAPQASEQGSVLAYLRVRPRVMPAPLTSTQIRNRYEKIGLVLPPLGWWQHGNHHRNEHGFVGWSVDPGNLNATMTLSQIFRDGEILGIDLGSLNTPDGVVLHAQEIVRTFEAALPRYLRILAAVFGAAAPFDVIPGVEGIKGAQIPLAYGFSEKCDTSKIEVPCVAEAVDTPARTILRPFYRAVWDACGIDPPQGIEDV